jgi:hypothetical protein
MREGQICGWIMATETLVPEFFALFRPRFQGISGVDLNYLDEHIKVDAEDHAAWMATAANDILTRQPEAMPDIVFGIEMAGRSVLAVLDALCAEYARGEPIVDMSEFTCSFS